MDAVICGRLGRGRNLILQQTGQRPPQAGPGNSSFLFYRGGGAIVEERQMLLACLLGH